VCLFVLAQVHGCLEVVALLLIAFELAMKVKWLGIRMFVCHVRTMLKVQFYHTVALLLQYQFFPRFSTGRLICRQSG